MPEEMQGPGGRPRRPRKNGNPARRRQGEPNPEVPCVCGCGQSHLQFDAHGRPRRALPGHHARAQATGRVLAQLELGLERPADIALALGVTPNAVWGTLNELRKIQRVEPFTRGRWRVVAKVTAVDLTPSCSLTIVMGGTERCDTSGCPTHDPEAAPP